MGFDIKDIIGKTVKRTIERVDVSAMGYTEKVFILFEDGTALAIEATKNHQCIIVYELGINEKAEIFGD